MDKISIIWQEAIIKFWGDSCFKTIFYFGLVIILFLEKKKTAKFTFVGYSLFVMLVIYNPLVLYVCSLFFGKGINYYCRLFALLPIPYIISYSGTLLCARLTGIKKILMFIVLGLIVITGGYSIYSEQWMKKAENNVKFSDDVIMLCQQVHGMNKKICLAAPSALATYIRQYDASILMPYGRYGLSTELRKELDKTNPDVDNTLKLAARDACDMVVIIKNDENRNAFESRGQLFFGDTGNYLIYWLQDIAGIHKKYNEKHQVVKEIFVDNDGRPKKNDEGYASVSYEYDQKGYRIKECYYDESNAPVKVIKGYYGVMRRFDKKQRVIEETYLDQAGEPSNLIQGIATIKYKRNKDGDVTEEYYYNCDKERVFLKKGYSGLKRVYNENHQIIIESYLDNDNNLIISQMGYASIEYEYDNNGHISAEYYMDTKGKPIALAKGYYGIRKEYDNTGNLVKRIYLDSAGKTIALENGTAILESVFDEKKNIVAEYYYGIDGSPLVLSQGNSGLEFVYNQLNQKILQTAVDVNHNAILLQAGIPRWHMNMMGKVM